MLLGTREISDVDSVGAAPEFHHQIRRRSRLFTDNQSQASV